MTEEIRFYRTTGNYGFLSNLYPGDIVLDISEWSKRPSPLYAPSAEHAYQWLKAKNPQVQDDIMNVKLPRSAAILGHGMFRFDVHLKWNEIKVQWMHHVLNSKFLQHEDLTKLLLATGDAILIEDSKTDAFWGMGKKGTGQNMLGRLLMEIRESELSSSSTHGR